MSSLKTFLISTILATAAVATSHEYNNGGGGGGNNWQPPSNQWNSWESGNSPPAHQTAPPPQSPAQTASPQWQAAPSCPAGCIPIPTGGAPPTPPPGQLMVQVVSVADANGSLKYFPNKIDAPVGSIVQFQFHPKVSRSHNLHFETRLTKSGRTTQSQSRALLSLANRSLLT
jgi:hypothetical protein